MVFLLRVRCPHRQSPQRWVTEVSSSGAARQVSEEMQEHHGFPVTDGCCCHQEENLRAIHFMRAAKCKGLQDGEPHRDPQVG